MSDPQTGFILGIETSNPADRAEVCLSRGGTVLATAGLDPAERHDDALIERIAGVCGEAGVTPRELGRVAVSLGPGGYSAVRIACTAAALIAEASGATLVGVPTAAALARGARAQGVDGPMLVVLASKREQAWCAGADGDGRLDAEPAVLGFEEIAQRASGRTIVAPAEICAALAACVDRSKMCAATFSAAAVIEAASFFEPIDPVELRPIYPREPEAVRKWRERAGA